VNPTRVCAVITDTTVAAARASIDAAASCADLVEVRLDYLTDFDFARPERLPEILGGKRLPAIITCRSLAEGGMQHVDDAVRLRLLVEGARNLAEYCDIEAAFYDQAARLSPDRSRLILSYHDFARTPQDLHGIYERVCSLPAAVHKIVSRAQAVSDCLAVFSLLDRAVADRRNLIALAMGDRGLVTRVLGPAHGSYLTYGTLASGRESAPGQPTCRELADLYRIREITRSTLVTGIIGRPVSHSASPAMHNAAFTALGLDYVYLPMEVDDLSEFFDRFVRADALKLNLRGLSVTIPHKTAVIPMLDGIDPVARRAGAVNTLVIDGGRITGYNTDVDGSMAPLEQVCSLASESVGVIGSGGAARAVILGLLERGASVAVFARDTDRAQPLADSFAVPVLPLEAISPSQCGILINTTPLGMLGHNEGLSPVPKAALANRRVVYDLVYNPIETRLLNEARESGCAAISGIEMLIAQAGLQFRRWTGKEAPLDVMREAGLRYLGDRLEEANVL